MLREVIVIDLNEGRYWGDCPMCDEYRRLDHAVGWYEEPVRQEIGETFRLPNGETVEVGGMPVCRGCHDQYYSEGGERG